MQFQAWYRKEFLNTLSLALRKADGISARQLDTLLDGRAIPQSLRDYYRVAGRHWTNSHYNRLLSPNELRAEHPYVIFMDENQCVAHWGFRAEDATNYDPEVYCGNWENNELVWYDQEQTLSTFIIASWLETCTGGDVDSS